MKDNEDQQKGASKKQLRIAELVKDQVGEEIKQELKQVSEKLETRLEKLETKAGNSGDETGGAADAPPIYQILNALQQPGFENDPEALRLLRQARGQGPQAELRLLADLAGLALKRLEKPSTKGSTVILPSGGGLPAPDLRTEYEKCVRALRAGDIDGLMEAKREFRRRGMEIW